MANIILTKDINNAFSQEVKLRMEEGLVIHSASMAGHQGEINKVDLTDGRDVYRVLLEKKSCLGEKLEDGRRFSGDKVVMQVRKYAGVASPSKFNQFHTIWNGDGEVVSEMEWFEVEDGRAYAETMEQAVDCKEKHMAAWKRTPKAHELVLDTEARRNIVRDLCRKERGYRRVKRAHILRVVCRVNSYDHSKSYEVYFTEECGKNSLTFRA